MRKPFVLVAGLMLIAAIALAQPRPGFDPQDVMRRSQAREFNLTGAGFGNGRFLVDTGFVHKVAQSRQTVPVVAFDGTNFLVVWVDDRAGESDLYGCRVTSAGVLLDSVGIPISTHPGTQWYPAVCFDGSNFLVVWWDQRSGGSDIYAARVSPGGTVLDTTGIPVRAGNASQPRVAFDGTNSLVVWADARTGSDDIYGARVTPAGIVLDTAGLPVCTYWFGQLSPAVSFNGTHYLVAWSDDRDGYRNIYGTRVTPAGAVLDSVGIRVCAVSANQYSPAVGSDGTNFFLTWQDNRSQPSAIYGTRVTGTGQILDSAGVRISNRYERQYEPAVAFDGVNFFVAWEEDRGSGLYGARVTPAGTVLDTTATAIPRVRRNRMQHSAAVCRYGNGSFVLWHEYDSLYNQPHIHGARVNRNGAVLDTAGILLSLSAYCQEEPAVAFDGTNFLVVWTDWRGVEPSICGARITLDGTVLDPVAIPVCTVASRQHEPAVAFDGTNFLVVWTDWRNSATMKADIYGARVTPAGNVLDPAGIAVRATPGTQQHPVVAFNGTDFLVAWQRGLGPGAPTDIECARVTSAGVVLDTAIVVSRVVGETYNPAVASDGTNALVVWADDRAGQYREDIYCARVTPAGVVLDTAGLPVCTEARSQDYPAVSFDGANYLVAWTDGRQGSGHYDIYAARVTPAGVVLDTADIPVCATADRQLNPSLCFDGTDHLVTWEDFRNGSYDIYGARVSPAGVVRDSALVAGGAGSQQNAALCRGSGGRVMLAFQDLARTVGGRTYNAQRIWGRLGLFPGVAEERPVGPVQRRLSGPTIVRGLLLLPRDLDAQLLDISGRKVMELQPGENDIRHLAPGVYFLRTEASRGQGAEGLSAKVVIQK